VIELMCRRRQLLSDWSARACRLSRERRDQPVTLEDPAAALAAIEARCALSAMKSTGPTPVLEFHRLAFQPEAVEHRTPGAPNVEARAMRS